MRRSSFRPGLRSHTSKGSCFSTGSRSRWGQSGRPKWLQIPSREGNGGGVEGLLNACAVLHIDENSSVRLLSNAVAYPRVELLSGTAVIQVDGGRENAVGAELRRTVLRLGTDGIYRLETEPPRIKVYAGMVTLEGVKKVGAGHVLTL